jgi:hypothetical protein
MTGSIGSVIARVLKGWFKDIELTNIPTVNGDSLLAIIQSSIQASGLFAVTAKGVTNGDSHDHSGGDGAQIAYSGLSGLPTLLGYALNVSALSFDPTDGATYYCGNLGEAPDTSASYHRIYIPKAGTIKAAYITWHCVTEAGTSENVDVIIRLNNTTDTRIALYGTTLSFKVFSNTALNIAVAQGDYIEIKMIMPSFATNPLDVRIGGTIYIE